MAVTFFEMLAPVLESSICYVARHLGVTEVQVYENIVAEATRNQAEWYSNRIPNLNYCSDLCRLAYLYIVAAANANTFKRVLESDSDLRSYVQGLALNRHRIRVCALGAGPGTELLAVAKFFDELQLGFCTRVDFQLLDRVEEWASSWFAIRDSVHDTFSRHYGVDFSGWPVFPSGNFLACDVTELSRLPNLSNIWNQDLYVVNFLLSEIFVDDPGLRAFLTEVANAAPTGSRFVFIERRGSMWQSRMSSIARDAKLALSPFVESQCGRLDLDERPADLGAIYRAIGERKTPRLGWNVVYSIGTKV